MTVKKVIFSVGVAHPLYNKPVDAQIITENGGYNGKCVYARTVEQVYYPEDARGLLEYKNGKFVGFKTRQAYTDFFEGWCDIV